MQLKKETNKNFGFFKNSLYSITKCHPTTDKLGSEVILIEASHEKVCVLCFH